MYVDMSYQVWKNGNVSLTDCSFLIGECSDPGLGDVVNTVHFL